MEKWRTVFRDGFAPLLPTAGLEAVAMALRDDSPELVQCYITRPMGRPGTLDDPVEGACLVGMCGWRGEGLTTVNEVEKFFAQVCWDADKRLGVSAECRYFLNFFDGSPRAEMRRELLAEVILVLKHRGTADASNM